MGGGFVYIPEKLHSYMVIEGQVAKDKNQNNQE